VTLGAQLLFFSGAKPDLTGFQNLSGLQDGGNGVFLGRANRMAGTITALKIQKRSKERVNLFLDGAYAFSLSLSAAATLKQGQYLSDADIEQLNDQYERYKAYQHALRFFELSLAQPDGSGKPFARQGLCPGGHRPDHRAFDPRALSG
jgi:hypothetical protein